MSYAFTLADMRTYLSYLRTKKQEVLFDQAADGAEETVEEEKDDKDNDTDFDPNKKKRENEKDGMDEDDDSDTDTNDVDTM